MGRLWRFLTGSLTLRVRDSRILRFLNGCDERGVRLFEIERQGGMTAVFSIGFFEKRELLRWVAEAGVEVEILHRQGLMPLLGRLFLRKGMLVGLALVLLTSAFFSRFVWVIKVEGEEPFAGQIKERIEQMGIKIGMPWKDIDLDEMNNALMMENDFLAYLITKREGITLKAELYMAVMPETPVDRSRTGDMVAIMDAQVTEISAYEGMAQVQPGDTVKAGDVLIKGTYEKGPASPLEEAERRVTARGKVMGRTWYRGVASVPMESVTLTPTGNSFTKRVMELGGWEIPLSAPEPALTEYTMAPETDTAIVGLFFPAKITTWVYQEVTVETDPVAFEEAQGEAARKAREIALRGIPAGCVVTDTLIRSEVSDGMVEVTVILEAIREIGEMRYD
ncbi:sporulation protein YqfD [Eubacteriales bacterium OttesenSCG-928-M02]|nr:sporulation protein YqfD [Eubacteriales bacterium OttesenSCG-928-M02]